MRAVGIHQHRVPLSPGRIHGSTATEPIGHFFMQPVDIGRGVALAAGATRSPPPGSSSPLNPISCRDAALSSMRRTPPRSLGMRSVSRIGRERAAKPLVERDGLLHVSDDDADRVDVHAHVFQVVDAVARHRTEDTDRIVTGLPDDSPSASTARASVLGPTSV